MHKRVIFRLMALVPYSVGVRLFGFVVSFTAVQKILFKRARLAMKRLKGELELSESVGHLTHRHVVSTAIDPWRIRKLATMSDKEYGKWVRLKNLELLQGCVENGRGVLIANSHSGMSRFLPLALLRSGVDATTLEADSFYKKLKIPSGKEIKSIELRSAGGFFLKAIFKAKKVLQGGGVLHMAPDGLQGMGEGESYSFLGKERTFFGSFASLAEKTGCEVVWVRYRVEDSGVIGIEFLSSPDRTEANEASSKESDLILGDYVKHVEESWRDNIASVQLRHLSYYLAL